MEKLNLWIARHKLIAFILLVVIPLFLLVYILSSLDAPVVFTVVIGVLWTFLSAVCVFGIEAILLDGPIKALDNCCDPTEFSEMVETLLSYKLSKGTREIFLINRSTALDCFGEIEKAYAVIKTVNVDFIYNIDVKLIYYSNLAGSCRALGKKEEALIWCDKVLSIYSGLKEGKSKRSLKILTDLALADIAVLKEDYAKAAELLEKIESEKLRQKVETSYLLGEVYIKLGENQKAKEKFNFVLVWGNKLDIVEKSKKILETL